ncbi:site-specific DNA-methyltransferase [uncultured Parolsenella sp.]|uniref:site-specific DNA-methyltransferase n=1 Tax=uncultured Parolsenella sp. TaxID=2083008 RepID=UPI00265AB01D|nr:site-specific DNA-methyltransferase [uncultured Parolsenella sp.]
MSEIGKMDLTSENVVDDRLAKLKELMPEVFSESGIDFDKLRLELGDEVDEGQERYAFTWPGKMDAIRQSQTVSEATLRPCVEKSRGRDGEDGSFDSDNIYIEGDNLEVLKLLQRGYHGKVKMIYIDPPYNTGHDFVYKDKFGDTIENYKEQAGLAGQSNAETSGRFHSDWCSMMYPRLRLARELLSDDGVIFISIDDNELNNAKKISDEIFGEDNFAAQFMWTKTMTPPALAYKCRKTVEYVLCYEKVANKSKFFGSWLENGDAPLLNTGNPVKELKFPAGTIRIGFLNRGSIPSGHYEGADILETIYVENGVNSNEAVLKGSFKWSQDTLEEEVSLGTYFLIKTNKMSVRFQRADGERYKTPTNYLPIKLDNSNGVGTNESASSDLDRLGMSSLFDYTKPKSLITTLVKMRCFLSGDDVVCDFFSGSSTTAVAIMELNEEDGGSRKSISIQLAEEIKPSSSDDAKKRELTNRRISFLDSLDRPHLLTEIGEERIRRAGDKIKAEVEEANKKLPDIGFRVFTLDNSGIEKPEPGKLVLDVVKPDRSDMDIVFEMMLKWGLELTLPVEQEEAADYPIYSVACGELVCCFAPGLTIEALEAIADIEPRRVLMRDSILTDSLKLNAAQVFKRVAEKTGREVELRTV